MPGEVRIVSIDPQGAPALALLAEAAAEVRPLYAAQPSATPPANAALGARERYVAAIRGGELLGCGALRELDAASAEIRRMFVRTGARRQGVGRALLAHLVREARRLGYRSVRLETGDRQPAAMALYERGGFRRIAPFGEYAGDPSSVCYERELDR